MFDKLEKSLEYTFDDKGLLKKALTHKSFDKSFNNERLEFLGDAVLDLVVAKHLYLEFKSEAEGDLSKIRSALVNEKSFAKIANTLDLGSFLFLSPAEEHNGGRAKPSLLSDAFEAILGAIYLESGYEKAEQVGLKLIKKCFPTIDLDIVKDYKTRLQELTQARFGEAPEYRVLRAFGPDHLKQFEVGLYINDKEYAKAVSSTKKQAHQIAAKIAYEKLEQNH